MIAHNFHADFITLSFVGTEFGATLNGSGPNPARRGPDFLN
jgi:hypothetical protein